MDINFKLKADFKRNGKMNYKIKSTLRVYRYGNHYYNSKNLINKLLYLLLRVVNNLIMDNFYGIELPLRTSIGPGLRLIHLNGIVISPNASIGSNCTIFHQVTIGANEHKHNYKEAPIIGNNVYIGSGAKIIGGIKIGDNVKIGANAVVTKNVPSGYTVVGNNQLLLTKSQRQGII